MQVTMIWNIAQMGELPKVGEKVRTSIGILPVVRVEPSGNGARYFVTCADGGIPQGTLD